MWVTSLPTNPLLPVFKVGIPGFPNHGDGRGHLEAPTAGSDEEEMHLEFWLLL